jgi:hypothetical protein
MAKFGGCIKLDMLKDTGQCFLISSIITCRSKEAIEWVWSFGVVKLSIKPHP